jgi:hypothetical protein
MPSRDLADVDRKLAHTFREMLSRFDRERGRLGEELRISQTLRTRLEQAIYYLQGRVTTQALNQVRAAAGMPAIKDAENKVITKTLASKHLPNKDGKSEAIDIFIMRKNKAVWDGSDPAYQVAVAIGKSLGLKWGGDWGWDAGHFETTP